MTQPPTTPTTASTNSKYDFEDGVIPKETLITNLSPKQNGEGEKGWSEHGPEEPTEVVAKDSGPPDGGYGWIVVTYFFLVRLVLIVELFVC